MEVGIRNDYQKHAKDVLRKSLMKRTKIAALTVWKLREFGAIKFGCNYARTVPNRIENANGVIETERFH